ncbi:hypothetical protein L0Y69_02330 [bacterium]|nr:hypothetical protein [bacterium]
MRTLQGFFFAPFLFATLSAFFMPQFSLAFEKHAREGPARNDFSISPAKIETLVAPGDMVTRMLTVSNRHARSLDFSVSVEDISGSNNPQDPVVIGGERVDQGVYSLKDFLKPEISSFTLGSNEEITFIVTISIPEDAPPGGKYGSVLISSAGNMSGSGGGAVAISRLAALFFVRVEGEAMESGELQDFRLREEDNRASKEKHFEIFYKNTGNVHLNPYGRINIKNIFGREVASLDVPPFFSLPGAARYLEIILDGEVLPGRYRATLLLNRGYGNIVDEKALVFWILPEKWVMGLALVLFILVLLWKYKKKR